MEIRYLGNTSYKLRGKNANLVTKDSSVEINATNRENPFTIDRPGEYEVNGVGVIVVKAGESLIDVIQMDGVVTAYCGGEIKTLSDKQVEKVGVIDVLLINVSGEQAMKVIDQLSPSIVIPIGEKVEEFLEKNGLSGAKKEDKLNISEGSLPEEMEIVVLSS